LIISSGVLRINPLFSAERQRIFHDLVVTVGTMEPERVAEARDVA
jgi:hypothetical protein